MVAGFDNKFGRELERFEFKRDGYIAIITFLQMFLRF